VSKTLKVPEPTALDRAIAAIAPGWGVKRLAARVRLAAASAYYDGATTGRRGASIRRSAADANTIGYRQLNKLRAGSRDLARNNAHAHRAVEAIVSNTVGDGIMPHFMRGDERAEDIEELAKAHLHTTLCDSDGLLTYGGQQGLGLQGTAEGGDVIVRRRWRRPSDRLPVPVQFQVLEGEYLDESKDGPAPGGGRIIQGVEFDAIGRRRAFWLHREHPGGRIFTSDSRPVPAADIAHVYRVDRPGQVRGIPWGAPVLLAHADFADYEEAQLMRQKIAACFAAFIEEPFDSGLPSSVEEDDDGNLIDSIEPGMVERLPMGTKVTFGDPPGVEGYAEYSNVSLHKIAMGWGVSYEALAGDLRGVNFSSGKMGRLEFQRNIDRWRAHMLVPMLCDRLMAWWLEAVALTGVDVTGVTVRHVAPRHAIIDPVREWPAIRNAIRSGQKTLSQVIRESGRDPVEHLKEYAADTALLDKLGIIIDSDARFRTNAGLGVAETSIQPDDEGGEDDEEEQARAMVEELLDELLAARGLGNGAHR
jgi:lambda family phage portal protein